MEITYKEGAQFSFADHAGDFAPAAGNSLERGVPTDVQITLAGVAAGAARQSAKFSLDTLRGRLFSLQAAIEFFSAPTTGGRVDFFIAWSPQATAGNGNPGGVAGADGAYDGGASLTLDEGLAQLDFVGSLFVGAGATVQASDAMMVVPKHRYGTLVVVNRTSVSLAATDDVETHVVLDEIIEDVA